MRMLVPHRLVLMPVRVRLGYGTIVMMLMVIVVDMTMLMRQRLVRMFMLVPFGEVEPQP